MNAALVTVALLAPAAPPAVDPPAPHIADSVRAGLQWLADQQQDDGSWAGNNGGNRTVFTSFAGLAFLLEGSTPNAGKYAPQIRKAITWMEKSAQDSGQITSAREFEANQYVPVTAQALLFLVCAHDADDDPDRTKRLATLIEKGITFLVEYQTRGGAWGFVSGRDGSNYDDCQSTTTVLQALFAARKAGFGVPREATDKGVRYLVNATNPEGGIVFSIFGGSPPRDVTQPLITAAAAAGVLMSDRARPEALSRWVRSANVYSPQYLRGIRTGGSYGLLPLSHMARAAFALGETGHRALDPDARAAELVRWSAFRAPLFRAVKDAQAQDGSWPDPTFGPVYSTALALVILQLDNDHVPALSR